MFVFYDCTFENRKATAQLCFKDLDTQIQDTLRKLPIDTFGCCPDLIDSTTFHSNVKRNNISFEI